MVSCMSGFFQLYESQFHLQHSAPHTASVARDLLAEIKSIRQNIDESLAREKEINAQDVSQISSESSSLQYNIYRKHQRINFKEIKER
jgi:hypothetical protein